MSYHAGAFVGILTRKFDEHVSDGPRVEIRAAHIVNYDLVLVLAFLKLDRGCQTQHNSQRLERRRAGVKEVILPGIELPTDES